VKPEQKEAVYKEALKSEELPLKHHIIELPNETPEQKFDRFVNHKDVDPAHLTASNLLSPIINTSSVDSQDPTFPAIYSPTGTIHLVNHQSSASQRQKANIPILNKQQPQEINPFLIWVQDTKLTYTLK